MLDPDDVAGPRCSVVWTTLSKPSLMISLDGEEVDRERPASLATRSSVVDRSVLEMINPRSGDVRATREARRSPSQL